MSTCSKRQRRRDGREIAFSLIMWPFFVLAADIKLITPADSAPPLKACTHFPCPLFKHVRGSYGTLQQTDGNTSPLQN